MILTFTWLFTFFFTFEDLQCISTVCVHKKVNKIWMLCDIDDCIDDLVKTPSYSQAEVRLFGVTWFYYLLTVEKMSSSKYGWMTTSNWMLALLIQLKELLDEPQFCIHPIISVFNQTFSSMYYTSQHFIVRTCTSFVMIYWAVLTDKTIYFCL